MSDEGRKDEVGRGEQEALEEKTVELSDQDLAQVSGGTGNERPTHSDFNVTKLVDVASPKLS